MKFRDSKNTWLELAYNEAYSEDQSSYDANEKARYLALIDLQYDFQETDYELIRFLFEQEIISIEKDSFSGMGNALMLGAFLLARYLQPTDIPLFFRAKKASFDAHCGFDIEYIFLSLKGNTVSYLSKNHPELMSDFRRIHFDSDIYENIDEWWGNQLIQYPDRITNENPLVLFERNLYFDNVDEAKKILTIWESTEQESERKQSYLKYAYKLLGELGKVISIVKNEIQNQKNGWDRVSVYRELLELYTLVGSPPIAMSYIENIDCELKTFHDWKHAGLGHMTIRTIFEYTKGCDDLAAARKAFIYADSWAKAVSNLPYTALEAGWHAAIKCNLHSESQRYKNLAENELARIKSM